MNVGPHLLLEILHLSQLVVYCKVECLLYVELGSIFVGNEKDLLVVVHDVEGLLYFVPRRVILNILVICLKSNDMTAR